MTVGTDLVQEFERILKMCDCAQTLFVTDLEGVPIITVGEELRGRQLIISNFQGAVDQMNKIGLGNHKVSFFSYEATQIVILDFPQVTVFICSRHPDVANVGLTMKLRNEISRVLPFLMKAVPQVLEDRMLNCFDRQSY